jgi:short-subunit dehydrogenase
MSDTFCQSSLITGESSGLGAAFARHLAKPGSRLVLVDRRSDRLITLTKELEKLGATVELLIADLATDLSSSDPLHESKREFKYKTCLNSLSLLNKKYLFEVPSFYWTYDNR